MTTEQDFWLKSCSRAREKKTHVNCSKTNTLFGYAVNLKVISPTF